jgi:chemotaxis methyl-accepting protein methylase
VVTTVPEFYGYVDHFESGKNTAIQTFFESFFTRSNVFLRNSTSFDSVDEFE